jgi:predicted dehydrogenase
MIKTGLIGNGYWGKIVGNKLDQLSDKVFVQTSSNYNPEEFCKVKWLFIVTPASTHFKIAKDAIENGVNVFIEKPFCSNASEAFKLISLARERKINLCIDNVFLYRSELLEFIPNNYRTIKFHWHKNGPFNDTLINDLFYHDLYLLIYKLGVKSISRVSVIKNEKNILLFSFFYGETEIKIDYNRIIKGVKEKFIIADNVLIKLTDTIQDPLKLLISKCLNDEIDFESNNNLNIITTEIIDILRLELQF